MAEFVRLEVDGGIGVIRLDRPPMNAISRQVQEELVTTAAEATNRADVRAVVLYGGERVLAAGADVKEMAAMSYADMAPVARRVSAGLGVLSTIPKPTVAAITGYALGGGLELALGCDRRIAGDNAKLGQPEILLGIIPGGGGTQRLPRLVGPARGKELMITGRQVKADEALRIGLADEVVAHEEVNARALALAAEVAAGPLQAQALTKRAVDEGLDKSLNEGLALERALFVDVFHTEDSQVGVKSFLEHGPGKATFTGR